MHPCILLFFSFVEYIGRRLAKLLQSQIRMIVYPEEYLPVTVQTGTIGQERNKDYKNPNHHTLLKQSPYVFKLLCILLPALQRGSCALIKLTSKYPCRYLQNTQNPLKSGWDGNLLCMYTAVLVNSLFRLQPRLALRPPEHISDVPLSHRGHCSTSLTHESLLWLNQSSEVFPAGGARLCELSDAANICEDKKICYNSMLSKLRK